MDLLSLGINLSLVGGIIALTQVVKKIDAKGKLARFYVLLPLGLGVVAAFLVTQPLTWQGVGVNAIIYAGVSSYFYVAKKKLAVGGTAIEQDATTAGPDGPVAGQ